MKLTLAFCTWLFFNAASGHSWVERINLYQDSEVQLPTSGYPRGNVLRTEPEFSDYRMTYQLPPGYRGDGNLYDTDPICSPFQLSIDRGVTRLAAGPGSTVVLQYNENGHITKPENNAIGKREGDTGEVFVYGTSDSQPTDTLLNIHKVWTQDGQGGDKRGRLLYQGPFDDGKCYQASTDSLIEAEREAQFPPPGSADPAQNGNLWCQSLVTLPADLGDDVYTLYWVWDWPFMATNLTSAKPQIYTTCMDIESPIVIQPITAP